MVRQTVVDDDDDDDVRPRSEPSLERMRVGMAPLTLTRPVDQAAPREPHHRSHADIVLSPTPPPRAPVQPPWQPPGRARAAVDVSPAAQQVPAAPPPPAAAVPTGISPVVVTVDAKARPQAPKPSDLLAYIRDDEK